MNLTERHLRFFKKRANVQGPEDCWNWTGFLNPEGYGSLSLLGPTGKRNKVGVHRIAAYLAGMDIEGLFVCHKCDNPSCVNPNHLFVGTPADNSRDMMQKGRGKRPGNKGEANGRHKLSEADVLSIRDFYASGKVTLTALGKRFRVNRDHISNIITRKHWKHI